MDWRAASRGPDGAQGRNRTTDTAIFSRMLYQLSYLGPSDTPEGATVESEKFNRVRQGCKPIQSSVSSPPVSSGAGTA